MITALLLLPVTAGLAWRRQCAARRAGQRASDR
jgi:hypothetical protein